MVLLLLYELFGVDDGGLIPAAPGYEGKTVRGGSPDQRVEQTKPRGQQRLGRETVQTACLSNARRHSVES